LLLLIARRKKISRGWTYVVLTCIFELLWIYGFNAAESWPHFILIALIIVADFYFLEKACETIQTGTVYAIFSAVGTVCTALMDTLIFNVEFTIAKGFFIALLIAGVISLKLAENEETQSEKE
jgi:paired small multidrug resistance pump